ncbi:MAG: hypothetical protein HY013_09585 [Candidatus Solibacter usitatus]|nr:hypothetical protein [Candidatus Solibacter usitatus]
MNQPNVVTAGAASAAAKRGIIIVSGKRPRPGQDRGIVIGIRPQAPASERGIIIVGGKTASPQATLAQRGIIIVGGRSLIR